MTRALNGAAEYPLRDRGSTSLCPRLVARRQILPGSAVPSLEPPKGLSAALQVKHSRSYWQTGHYRNDRLMTP